MHIFNPEISSIKTAVIRQEKSKAQLSQNTETFTNNVTLSVYTMYTGNILNKSNNIHAKHFYQSKKYNQRIANVLLSYYEHADIFIFFKNTTAFAQVPNCNQILTIWRYISN